MELIKFILPGEDYIMTIDKAQGPSESGYVLATFNESSDKWDYKSIPKEEFYKRKNSERTT